VAEGAARVSVATLTVSKRLQVQCWTAFREYVLTHGKRIKPTKPLPQNWSNRPDTHDCPARGSSVTSTLCPIMASSIGRRHPDR
jgi:hypothetical protein